MPVVRALDVSQAVNPAGDLPARGGKQRGFAGMTAELHAQPRPLRQADDPQRRHDPAALRQSHIQEIGRALLDGREGVWQAAERLVEHDRDAQLRAEFGEREHLGVRNGLFEGRRLESAAVARRDR